MDEVEDKVDRKHFQVFCPKVKLQVRPWRLAFRDLVGQDPFLLGGEAAWAKRRQRLLGGLSSRVDEDIEARAARTKLILMEILWDKTAFHLEKVDEQELRQLLTAYFKVLVMKSRLKSDDRTGPLDQALKLHRSRLGDMLFRSCEGALPHQQLAALLENAKIKTSAEVLRLLVAEINGDRPFPRVLALARPKNPDYWPFYVALPEGEFSQVFMTVCRIFGY